MVKITHENILFCSPRNLLCSLIYWPSQLSPTTGFGASKAAWECVDFCVNGVEKAMRKQCSVSAVLVQWQWQRNVWQCSIFYCIYKALGCRWKRYYGVTARRVSGMQQVLPGDHEQRVLKYHGILKSLWTQRHFTRCALCPDPSYKAPISLESSAGMKREYTWKKFQGEHWPKREQRRSQFAQG